jgi:hypothetical protein
MVGTPAWVLTGTAVKLGADTANSYQYGVGGMWRVKSGALYRSLARTGRVPKFAPHPDQSQLPVAIPEVSYEAVSARLDNAHPARQRLYGGELLVQQIV